MKRRRRPQLHPCPEPGCPNLTTGRRCSMHATELRRETAGVAEMFREERLRRRGEIEKGGEDGGNVA